MNPSGHTQLSLNTFNKNKMSYLNSAVGFGSNPLRQPLENIDECKENELEIVRAQKMHRSDAMQYANKSPFALQREN